MIDSTMNSISESHHKYEKREQRWSQDLELGGQKYKQIYIYIYMKLQISIHLVLVNHQQRQMHKIIIF